MLKLGDFKGSEFFRSLYNTGGVGVDTEMIPKTNGSTNGNRGSWDWAHTANGTGNVIAGGNLHDVGFTPYGTPVSEATDPYPTPAST